MVITREFTWLHFGKTAGTSFRSGLCALFDVEHVVPDNLPLKHANLAVGKARGLEIPEDRPIICGFRRLESWVQSHLRQQYGNLIPREVLEATIEGQLILSDRSPAKAAGIFDGVHSLDDLVDYYFAIGNPIPIRQESIISDFLSFYSSINGQDTSEAEITEAFMVKKNTALYTEANTLNESQCEKLRASCPRWVEYEECFYG